MNSAFGALERAICLQGNFVAKAIMVLQGKWWPAMAELKQNTSVRPFHSFYRNYPLAEQIRKSNENGTIFEKF